MEKSTAFIKISRIVALLVIIFPLAACGQAEDTHPGQPVTKRKLIFKEILRTVEPMGLVMRGRKPYDQAQFLQQAIKLQGLSTQPWKYFTPDSNYSPTRAKPDVWDKPVEFKQAQQKLITATGKLVAAAQSGDMDLIHHDFSGVEESCKACHQQFRGIPH
ncbi:MAG: c-type cytochrome [Sulfuriferula sp.]